jgi:hypothetical protein
MTEQYPINQLHDEVEVRINGDEIRAEVTGISYVCPVYMYVVELDTPIDGEFGPQTGFFVPESILVPKPDLADITQLSTIGTYVYVDEDETSGEVIALDVTVKVGTEDNTFWYVVSDDARDGLQPIKFVPFSSKDEAIEFAKRCIEESHAAAPGENAEQYLARIEQEGEGESAD